MNADALLVHNVLLFSAVLPGDGAYALAEALREERYADLEIWRREGSLALLEGWAVAGIFLGAGTASREVALELERKGLPYRYVDERDSTLAARAVYWQLHPPRGLWTLFPTSLRVPPRDIDDLAAWVIATRGLKEEN